MSIEWNDKAKQYLSEVQRAALENGRAPDRLNGSIRIDKIGNVWFCEGEHKKLIGTTAQPPPAQPSDSAPARDLDPQDTAATGFKGPPKKR